MKHGMATTWVTGANRGIGLALCRLLRERGDDVVAVCRRSGPDLEGLGVRVESGVDVTSDADVAALARRLAGVRLFTAILNAGILRESALDAVDLVDDARAQLEVNAIGPLRLAAALRSNLGAGSKLALITSRMARWPTTARAGTTGTACRRRR
jgi:NAD(P)-dependent dehydrogenase (short-subunit alcohol dehydrogenase family)